MSAGKVVVEKQAQPAGPTSVHGKPPTSRALVLLVVVLVLVAAAVGISLGARSRPTPSPPSPAENEAPTKPASAP
jgi:hypothetical protein